MKKLPNPFPLLLVLAVAGCTAEGDDIQSWMNQQTRGMSGTVEPLPEMQTFPVVSYAAMAEVDPFRSSRIEPEARAAATGGPDLNRQREPLEAYPLESISMVGVLEQSGRRHALVRVDGALHQVRVGNYMGQNHGVIMEIADAAVVLTEIVEDMSGDWVERTSRLRLQER